MPSRRALVLSEPASEPASGSVRQNEPTISPDAMRGSHCAFCSAVPSMTMPCEPMPLLVPMSERKAGEVAPKPEGDLRLLGHGEPEAAILLRDRQAEEAERAHLGDDLGRDAVLLGDALLERPQALGHEARDGVEELGERVAVERHPKDLSACAAGGSWRSPPSGPRQRGGRAQQAAILPFCGFGLRPQAAFCRSRRSGTFRSARLASSLSPMTKLLDAAVEAARKLPAESQDEIARVVLHLAASEEEPEPIAAAHLPAVLEGLAQARRREFATDEEVEAAFRRFDA